MRVRAIVGSALGIAMLVAICVPTTAGAASPIPPVNLFVANPSYPAYDAVEIPAGSGPIIETDGSAPAPDPVAVSGMQVPFFDAVDGHGDLFITDQGKGDVVEAPAGGGAQRTVISGLNEPEGIAVDGAGDLFVADSANKRVVELPAGNSTLVTLATGLTYPTGLAVDAHDNVFVSVNDEGESIFELPAGGGAMRTVASGLSDVGGVAVDAAGDVFAGSSSESGSVTEVLPNGTHQQIGSGMYQPIGVATDAAGDLFVVSGPPGGMGQAAGVEEVVAGTTTLITVDNALDGIGIAAQPPSSGPCPGRATRCFTSADNKSDAAGTFFTFPVTTSGTPTPKIREKGKLPKGLKFHEGTGTATISGTPTSTKHRSAVGTYNITLTATFGNGKTKQIVTQSFSLTVT